MPVVDINFRSVGFTDDAVNYPRDHLGLVAIAAWNGVPISKLPEAMKYYPNESTKNVWERVIAALLKDDNDWFDRVVRFFVEHKMLDERDDYDISDIMTALEDNYQPDPETERPERVQAAFEVFAGKEDTGPTATEMFHYILYLENKVQEVRNVTLEEAASEMDKRSRQGRGVVEDACYRNAAARIRDMKDNHRGRG